MQTNIIEKMKRILIATLSTVICAGCASNNTGNGGPTIFQGRFIGYSNEYVEFFEIKGGDFVETPVKVNPDGTFCDTLQFESDKYDAALFADRFMFRVSLEQGKTYTAEFDLREEGVETNFRFTGEGEAENAFLSHYVAANPYEKMKDVKSFDQCQKMLDKLYAPLLAELKTVDNKPFEQFYEDEIKSCKKVFLCYSPFHAAQASGSYVDDPSFEKFIAKNYNLSDEEFAVAMKPIFNNVAYMMPDIDATSALKAAASCAAKPVQKESAMTMMLESLVKSGNFNGLADAWTYFKEVVENKDCLKLADGLCRNALSLTPGTQAPEIEFKDSEGNVHKIADFAGKPLYIDFWASWCGPCCAEIPHLKKFVESLGSNPEINCISISIDSEESDWTAKLDEEKPTWPQFIATKAGMEAISDRYFINSIPRFLLIDAEGKIASVNAPRPSSADLLDKLKGDL